MLEYFRAPFLLYLAGLLGCLMILVAGMKGLRAILTLFVTAFVVLYVLVPLTIKGFNPIVVTLLVSAFLTLTTFVLITGFSFKVISGVLGTLGGLVAVGILSVISMKTMILTGLAQESVSRTRTRTLAHTGFSQLEFRGYSRSGDDLRCCWRNDGCGHVHLFISV